MDEDVPVSEKGKQATENLDEQLDLSDGSVNEVNNNNNFIYIASTSKDSEKVKVNFFLKNFFYKIKKATSKENSLKIVQSVFELNKNNPVNFFEGEQTSKRYRIAIPLESFSKKKLLIKLMKKNFQLIRNIHPNYAIDFEPNALILCLVKPGSFLKSHLNDKFSNQSFVAVWSFGCTIDYNLEIPKSFSNLYLDESKSAFVKKFCIPIESRDFVTFNG